MQRRVLLLSSAALALSGCGYQLRRAPDFAFRTFQASGGEHSALVAELQRQLTATGRVQVVTDPQQLMATDVVLDVLNEQRERVVVGVNASGQVRELQLRLRFTFRLRTPRGKVLIPDVELLQKRDVSYLESAALAKEAEEALLNRDMQSDIVQQVMRRLAAVRAL